MSAKLRATITLIPTASIAQTADSRELPQPKFRPATRTAAFANCGFVEWEGRIERAVRKSLSSSEEQLREVRLEASVNRGDLVGVHVVGEVRDGDSGNGLKWLHAQPRSRKSRTSTISPAIAAAAAVAGLARCVLTPAPCRFSKLRLVVEMQRSPGSPRSPLPAAHIEHPTHPTRSRRR